MALRLGARTGARTAQRTATRAAVLPSKEARTGLRNFSTAPRSINLQAQRPAISIASPFAQKRCISERSDGRGGKIYEFEDVRALYPRFITLPTFGVQFEFI
jgi:hypothetical protein